MMPPETTFPGRADLWALDAGMVGIAEIKSTFSSPLASIEAAHYTQRHDESNFRTVTGTGGLDDLVYLASTGGIFAGSLMSSLSAVTGSGIMVGTFIGDPGKELWTEADSAGAVVYWCTGPGITGPAIAKAFQKLAKAAVAQG